MHERPRLRVGLSLLLSFGIGVSPLVQYAHAAPQGRSSGQGEEHRADPCADLPDPPGNAKGIDKHCPAGGSSSGVTKGDFNGDGFADLAIGEPGATIDLHASAGDVIILYGSANGLTSAGKQIWYQGPDKRVPGSPEAGDLFGAALASGDFNKDGYSDLAIGVPGESNSAGTKSGAVDVIYGSATGLTTTDLNHPPKAFDLSMAPTFPTSLPIGCGFRGFTPFCASWDLDGAGLGSSLAWGDFNGDGTGDLVIGAPNLTYSYNTFQSSYGGVWQLLGSSTGGLTTTGNHVYILEDTGHGSTDGDRFGAALSAGDFNGDGLSDVAIGIPNRDTDTATNSGLVLIMLGSVAGINPGGSQTWSQESPNIIGAGESNDHFGAALAAGDFNGDGKSDLAVGVPGEDVGSIADAGAVSVIYGSSSGLTSAGNQFWDQIAIGGVDEAGAQFGTALAAGDFNGDTRVDLAVGAPFKDVAGGAIDAGEVNVIYGSSSLGLSITGRSAQVWHSSAPQSGSRFGASLTAWNFGRNETSVLFPPVTLQTADLAIGAPYQTVSGVSGAGAVHVIYGSSASNGLTSTNRATFTAASIGIGGQTGAHFGAAIY